MKTLDLASDVIAGSTTFAGLIIVYVGAVGSAYASYEKSAQKSVRKKFRRRAAIGSIGVISAGLVAACGLPGKWATSKPVVGAGAILLVVTLILGIYVAVEIVRKLSNGAYAGGGAAAY